MANSPQDIQELKQLESIITEKIDNVMEGKDVYLSDIIDSIRDYRPRADSFTAGIQSIALRNIEAVPTDRDTYDISSDVAGCLMATLAFIDREISGVSDESPEIDRYLEAMTDYCSQLAKESDRLRDLPLKDFDTNQAFDHIQTIGGDDQFAQESNRALQDDLANFIEQTNDEGELKDGFVEYLQEAGTLLEQDILDIMTDDGEDSEDNDDED